MGSGCARVLRRWYNHSSSMEQTTGRFWCISWSILGCNWIQAFRDTCLSKPEKNYLWIFFFRLLCCFLCCIIRFKVQALVSPKELNRCSVIDRTRVIYTCPLFFRAVFLSYSCSIEIDFNCNQPQPASTSLSQTSIKQSKSHTQKQQNAIPKRPRHRVSV